MSSQTIIQDHHLWRTGGGGAPAGLVGQADSFAYAGLDLNLAEFMNSTFNGSSFNATTFKQAKWTGCTFTGCTFTGCSFDEIAITGCTFTGCTFTQGQFSSGRITSSRFSRCSLNNVDFDRGHWQDVALRDCGGDGVRGHSLQGQRVDFTGSTFERLDFTAANIN